MTRLLMVIYSMASVTLAGSLVVVALATGHDTLQPILVAAILGFVVALPVSWLVARRLG
ncbi:MAG: CTP synthetase [Paracoccaceae bacterium]|nr:MAG: CTP synthetase [Paracoccaceae bacterium]